jgi:hypothetical protein
MKCIPECNYNVKPDNITVLNHHMLDCYIHGAMTDITEEPGIVWRNGELHVSLAAEVGDVLMQGNLVVPEAPVKAAPKKRATKKKTEESGAE